MTDQPAEQGTEEIKANAPVTITLSIDELLNHLVPDYNGDPSSIHQDLIAMAAHKIVKDAADYDFQQEIREAVRRSLDSVVLEALTTFYQPSDTYGMNKGEPTSLREELIKQAKNHLEQAMMPADRYGDSKVKGSVRQFITDEVERTFHLELKGAVDAAKQAVLDAVAAKGTAFMTEAFADAAVKVAASMPSKGPHSF